MFYVFCYQVKAVDAIFRGLTVPNLNTTSFTFSGLLFDQIFDNKNRFRISQEGNKMTTLYRGIEKLDVRST